MLLSLRIKEFSVNIHKMVMTMDLLYKGTEPGSCASDDERVHLTGRFVGVKSFRIGDKATDMIIQQDAVSTQHFTRVADALPHLHTTVGFCHRRVFILENTGFFKLCQAQAHAFTGGNVREHAEEQVLHELKRGDRTAKLLALLRIFQSM